jgi:hypothetical protein
MYPWHLLFVIFSVPGNNGPGQSPNLLLCKSISIHKTVKPRQCWERKELSAFAEGIRKHLMQFLARKRAKNCIKKILVPSAE